MRGTQRHSVTGLACVLLVGCDVAPAPSAASPPPTCVPGATQLCHCSPAQEGIQSCNPQGTFDACRCTPIPCATVVATTSAKAPPPVVSATAAELPMPYLEAETKVRKQQKLTGAELVFCLESDACRLVRNAIYANRGRRFQSPDLRNFFAARPWYRPLDQPASLSAVDTHNVALIMKLAGANRQRPAIVELSADDVHRRCQTMGPLCPYTALVDGACKSDAKACLSAWEVDLDEDGAKEYVVGWSNELQIYAPPTAQCDPQADGSAACGNVLFRHRVFEDVAGSTTDVEIEAREDGHGVTLPWRPVIRATFKTTVPEPEQAMRRIYYDGAQFVVERL